MLPIREILKYLSQIGVEYCFIGDVDQSVSYFSAAANYRSNTFTWISTEANIPNGFPPDKIKLAFCGPGLPVCAQNMVQTERSKFAFFSCIEHFYYKESKRTRIGQFSYLAPGVRLGKNVRIGHHCTLDGDIEIGDNTIIWNSVTIINRVKIGKCCEIQSGAVIGHDGYGYIEDVDHSKKMIRHFGGVTIGDNVFIGSNTCIVRGTIDDTVIKCGTKIDNLCHIAHNCQIGKNVSLAFPCHLGGSCQIMDNTYIASSTIRDHCIIGCDAFVGMGANVVKDVPRNQTVVGNPAKPLQKRTIKY